MGIILTVSKLFRYAPAGEYVCATGARGARTLRCGENDYKVVLHRFPGAHLVRFEIRLYVIIKAII